MKSKTYLFWPPFHRREGGCRGDASPRMQYVVLGIENFVSFFILFVASCSEENKVRDFLFYRALPVVVRISFIALLAVIKRMRFMSRSEFSNEQ